MSTAGKENTETQARQGVPTMIANNFDYQRWEEALSELEPVYSNGEPFPHIVLENFLPDDAARAAMQVFPGISDEGWIHYVHVNERKHGLNKIDQLPGEIRLLLAELNSRRFLDWLSALTGISDLKADPTYEGGGLHQTAAGGFLNIHADFTVHPHRRNWRRRINLLVYLNEPWERTWGGELELWDRGMKRCVKRIAPFFNQAVIFNTDADSYHGQPDALRCPDGVTRKSIALYYFTEEDARPVKRVTQYKARPGDGFKRVLIRLDQWALEGYSRTKSALGLNDDFASKLLGRFGRNKKPPRHE